MKTELIAVHDLSLHCNIEYSFMLTLHESGLIELVKEEEKLYVPADAIRNIEKMANLYYDMGINIEGIETISHLLRRLDEMQQEVLRLKNTLALYE